MGESGGLVGDSWISISLGPVRGNGDGGIYSTAADLSALWDALHDGRVVAAETLAEMVRPRSDWPEESRRYGLGFHLDRPGTASSSRGTTPACPSAACTALQRADVDRRLELDGRRLADRPAPR